MRRSARSMRSELNRQTAVGRERTFTIVAFLVDTNVLVYRFDARYPEKQRIARDVLHLGLRDDSARIPHQALIEFVSAVTRTRAGSDPLLSADEARHEVEELMMQFPILYPNAAVVRSALLGAAAYKISWFDAQLWAYAEHYGLDEILSEDFEHGRLYGSVRVRNPFRRG
jgi:predicted nucleic acid-binding protein